MESELRNVEIDDKPYTSSIVADLCQKSCTIPINLLNSAIWKDLPPTSKEIYLVLASNYDYKEGLSKMTHSTIQNASGIGSRATIVKALNILKELAIIHVVEVGIRSRIVSHNYLMPYQEELYAQMLGEKPRDFSHYNPVKYKKTNKKKKSISDKIDPLFFNACHKLSCLKIDTPNKLIEKYSDDSQTLRTIIFLCDCAFIINKHRFMPDEDVFALLTKFIEDDNIKQNAFGDDITKKVKNVLIKNKEKTK